MVGEVAKCALTFVLFWRTSFIIVFRSFVYKYSTTSKDLRTNLISSQTLIPIISKDLSIIFLFQILHSIILQIHKFIELPIAVFNSYKKSPLP